MMRTRSLWLLALLAGCGSGGATAGTPDAGLPPLPTDKPLAWFAPLPRAPADGSPNVTVGTTDFMDLFQASAPWTQAAGHTRVVKLNCGSIQRQLTDAQLSTILAEIDRRGMFLAVEGGPLQAVGRGRCGDGVEGFAQDESYACLRHIQQLGGHTRYFAMDEPFDGAVLYTGTNSCGWSAQQVATALKEFRDAARAIEPELVVGDIECLCDNAPVSAFTDFMDAYATAAGAKLPFFHLDIDYARADWPARSRDLEDAARARGIDFGVIYDGRYADGSDAEWNGHAADTFAILEGQLGGKPEHVLFQSWESFPVHNLPEDQADTFTHLIDRYFGTRTALTVSLGATKAQGTLTGGASGASIALTLTPLDGAGDVGDLVATGTVPAGATKALCGVRVNTECNGCAGASDVAIYRASYVEGSGSNLVPNPDFASGLTSWGSSGTGSVMVAPSDQGGGNLLHLLATASQSIQLNGGMFTVTPGASYTVDFTARVSPASVGSGDLVLIFLGPSAEITRVSLPLAPVPLSRVATTAADGTFQADLPAASGKRRLDASYAGDALRWPAFASATSP
jgi:hypothetical protein